MMFLFSLHGVLVCLFLLSAVNGQLPGIFQQPNTVSKLNLTAFSGRWFQMYTSMIPRESFERDLLCVVSDVGVKHVDMEVDNVELRMQFSAK
jgi:hypothetical protein